MHICSISYDRFDSDPFKSPLLTTCNVIGLFCNQWHRCLGLSILFLNSDSRLTLIVKLCQIIQQCNWFDTGTLQHMVNLCWVLVEACFVYQFVLTVLLDFETSVNRVFMLVYALMFSLLGGLGFSSLYLSLIWCVTFQAATKGKDSWLCTAAFGPHMNSHPFITVTFSICDNGVLKLWK